MEFSSGITTIYHVTVEIPPEVWAFIHDTPREQEFDRLTIEACQGNVGSGTNFYSDVWLWADFHSYPDAESCRAKLITIVGDYCKLYQKDLHERQNEQGD